MKTVISKKDGKKYFKTIAKCSGNADDFNAFIKGKIYWVRNVDASDNVDADKYCAVKGDFYNFADAQTHIDVLNMLHCSIPRETIPPYTSTYIYGLIVLKSQLKLILDYCD